MSIDTRQNRPNGESSHAPEERNYSEHGRRKPGDARFASGSAAGYPYKSPHYTPPEEDSDAQEDLPLNYRAQVSAYADTNGIAPEESDDSES